eukprot:NODE_3_length_80033_cov_0.932970.p41 type:complete len:241 gc:universal NODE_3_length_80033_cov_0.932970:8266-7544(-)
MEDTDWIGQNRMSQLSTLEKCSAVIFDMDGLLLNTEDIYTEATSKILARFGITYTWDLKMKLMGLDQKDAANLLIQKTNISLTPEEYLIERNNLHRELFPNCKILQGVQKFVSHLKYFNIPIAVASSSHRSAFDLKTKNHQELFSMFSVVVLGDDPELKRGKPNEDIFVLAAQRLGVERSSSIVVLEDALAGLDAANRAGFTAIWIPHLKMSNTQHDFECIKFQSVADIDPKILGIPPYE